MRYAMERSWDSRTRGVRISAPKIGVKRIARSPRLTSFRSAATQGGPATTFDRTDGSTGGSSEANPVGKLRRLDPDIDMLERGVGLGEPMGGLLRAVGIAGMVGGLTIFVAGVFIADRAASIVVSLVGVGVMLAGVAVTNHAQQSEIGPGW
jgi:hypothetical protein